MNKKEILIKLNKISKPVDLKKWGERIKKHTMEKANVIIEQPTQQIIVRGRRSPLKFGTISESWSTVF